MKIRVLQFNIGFLVVEPQMKLIKLTPESFKLKHPQHLITSQVFNLI